MLDNFYIALTIMGKGMAGIFTVIILISLAVALMGRLGSGKNGPAGPQKEKEEQ